MKKTISRAMFLLILVVPAGAPLADIWEQTTWTGGSGQQAWSDTTMYLSAFRMNGVLNPGDLHLDTPDDSVWVETGLMSGVAKAHCLDEDASGNIYCGTAFNGDVFKSTDDGITWSKTAELPGAFVVYSLICDSDGNVWAGIEDSGDVFISTNGGTSWTKTAEIPGASRISSLVETPDGVYAGTWNAGDVFRTTDNGASWIPTADITDATDIMAMMFSNDTLWVGTYPKGDVFLTTNRGTTWETTGDLAGAEAILAFLDASDGNIYASTSWNTGVFKTTNRGMTWLETGSLPNAFLVWCLVEVNQKLYAGTKGIASAHIFRSTDWGNNWVDILDLPNGLDIYSFLHTSKGFLFIGTATTGGRRVFRAGYYPHGFLVSSVFQTSGNYGSLSWSITANGMIDTVRVRTDTLADMSTASPWPSCPAVTSGQDISSLSSVRDTDPYVQYRVEMTSFHNARSPFLHWIRLEYGTGITEDERRRVRGPAAMTGIVEASPNPFRRQVRILYSIKQDGTQVTLAVYDISGRMVKIIREGEGSAGVHEAVWDGRAEDGAKLQSGTYFLRLKTQTGTSTTKLTILE